NARLLGLRPHDRARGRRRARRLATPARVHPRRPRRGAREGGRRSLADRASTRAGRSRMTGHAAEVDVVHRQHYNVTFTLLAVATVAYALLQSLVAPALLTIQNDLHTTTAGAAGILSAYLLSASVVTPIAGRLGDMFGN